MTIGFPVHDDNLRSYRSWEERLSREARRWWVGSNGNAAGYVSPAVRTTVTALTTTPAFPRVSEVMYLEDVTVSVNKPMQITFAITGVPTMADPARPIDTQYFQHTFGAADGGSIKFPIKKIIRSWETTAGYQAMSVNCVNYLGPNPGTDIIYASIQGAGHLITDDLNLGASDTIMWVGDSISAGQGATQSNKSYTFIVKDYLRSQGYDCRLALKALRGTKTADHEVLRQQYYHDIAQVSLGIYSLGTNADTSVSVSVANLTAYWDWFKVRYPKAMLVVTGPAPVENVANEANNASLRTAFGSFVQSVNSPRLKFINFGGLWTPTDPAYYDVADTAGNRKHPNDLGNAAMASEFINQWNAQGLKIPSR